MSEKNTCNIYDKVVDIVGEENVHTDEPMSRHTTFRIGGNADYFVKPGMEAIFWCQTMDTGA